jgi:hypothetical protein
MWVVTRWIVGTFAACAFFLYAGLSAFTHSNYLVTHPASSSLGWSVNQVEVTKQRFPAPDGSNTAIKVTSEGADGHLTLVGLDLPRGPVTYSVYLRADSRLTLKVIMYPGKLVETTARVTAEWQRFVVTAKRTSTQKVTVLVGGGGTFTKGEAIYVAWPQLNAGDKAGQYAVTQQHQLSRIESKISKLKLRTHLQRVLWIGVICLIILVSISWNTTPIKATRLSLSQCFTAYRENRWHLRTAILYSTITIATLCLLGSL